MACRLVYRSAWTESIPKIVWDEHDRPCEIWQTFLHPAGYYWQKYRGPSPTSHGHSGHRRRAQHRAHQQANHEYNQLGANTTIPWRHPNRHLPDAYYYDDEPYYISRHSTGWKPSTKCRYQYLIHVK